MLHDTNEPVSRKRIIAYWIATTWIFLPMAMGGVMDLIMAEQAVEITRHLGYPDYFLVILGLGKILGAITLLAPGLPRLKEWAYAGIAIDLLAAIGSHMAVGDPIVEAIIPAGLLGVMTASYLLRPPGRFLPSASPATAASATPKGATVRTRELSTIGNS